MDMPLDQPAGFKLTECLNQHLFRDAGQGSVQ
jgi:hypothetical protein